MEPSRRNSLIVLAVVLVLGIGVILWGTARQQAAPGPGNRKQRAESVEISPTWAGLGEKLRRLGPKLRLDRDRFEAPPAVPPRPLLLGVPAQAGEKYRTAKFRLATGAGRIEYDDVTPDAGDLEHQSIEFPAKSSERSRQSDPTAGSLLMLENGGKLRFFCNGPQPCVFTLE